MNLISELKDCEEYSNGFHSFVGVEPELMERVIRALTAGEALKEVIKTHEIETLDCDRRGEKYCNCLEKALDTWNKAANLQHNINP